MEELNPSLFSFFVILSVAANGICNLDMIINNIVFSKCYTGTANLKKDGTDAQSRLFRVFH
jgi:hypothetical protein